MQEGEGEGSKHFQTFPKYNVPTLNKFPSFAFFGNHPLVTIDQKLEKTMILAIFLFLALFGLFKFWLFWSK